MRIHGRSAIAAAGALVVLYGQGFGQTFDDAKAFWPPCADSIVTICLMWAWLRRHCKPFTPKLSELTVTPFNPENLKFISHPPSGLRSTSGG